MRVRIATAAVFLTLALNLPARAGNYTDWWWGGSAAPTCPSHLGTASLDLTLFVLDRALVGWQRATSMASGCTQTDQIATIRAP